MAWVAGGLLVSALMMPAGVHAGDALFRDGFEPCGGSLSGEQASVQIAAARAAADGSVDLPIAGALVTYIKPAVGSEPAGFFVQACKDGPALFVAVDPALLNPVPAAGDAVQFTITTMGTSGDLRQALAISGFGIDATGQALAPLVQDLSAATDLVSGLDGYESELAFVAGSVADGFVAAGTEFESAMLETAGVAGNPDLRLRLPAVLRDSEDVAPGCVLEAGPTPLWRFGPKAEVSAWQPQDLALLACPAPIVGGAVALGPTDVRVDFDRRIEPSSVDSAGEQFTFDSGLAATAATVSGRTVNVTTTVQAPGHTYLVQVASSVTDTLGSGVGSPSSATFTGRSCTGGTIYFSEDFSDNLQGWTLEGEWGIGPTAVSTGQQQGNSDPASDQSTTVDNGVAGIVLGGNYSNSVHAPFYLTSPVIDLTGESGTVNLSYWRWLNCDQQPFVKATIDVWNGTSWVNIWQNSTSELTTDSAWTRFEFDVTAYKNAAFKVRFGHGTGMSGSFLAFIMSGWNVDDLTLASGTCQ
ncbi:MAG TPA: Ig-like domain-containing protein [Gammaproteobacteria bacterium]|nr:Ig-like domain-containing protein [Gammaproteobacteria bacterium]